MENQLDVFFYEAFEEEEASLRRLVLPGLRVGFVPSTIQEHGDAHPPAPIISIRTQSEIPLSWASELKAIIARTTGYDHLKTYKDATGSKLPCGHLPKYCSRAVAEQAMVLWMSLLRKVPAQIEHFKTFDRDGLTGLECEGKNLLVVGVGNIGSEIVRIGAGLGMKVRGVDIVRRHTAVDYISIEEGLPSEDEGDPVNPSDPNWLLGERQRHRGSLHQDVWKGTAAELASRGFIAVYPAMGWWRTRPALERYELPARYSLVVSIQTQQMDVDLYTAVAQKIPVANAVVVNT